MLESGVAGHIKRFHAVTSHRWHRGHFFFNNLFSGLIWIRMSSWCDKLISGRMLMSGKDHWKHYCEIDVERVPWQRCCTVKRSWRRGLSINSGIKRLHGVTHLLPPSKLSSRLFELWRNLLMVDSISYSKLNSRSPSILAHHLSFLSCRWSNAGSMKNSRCNAFTCIRIKY